MSYGPTWRPEAGAEKPQAGKPVILLPIENALLDENLLGAALGDDIGTWGTWLTVLKAAFARPLSDDEREIFAQVSGGRKPPEKPVSELWIMVGRRGGKSRASAAMQSYLSQFWQYRLAPGEIGYGLVLANAKRQASMVREYTRAFFLQSPVMKQSVLDATTEELRLAGNITLMAHTNNFRTIRGGTLICAIFDEVAFWRDENTVNPDKEVYDAVGPALATTGGMLIAISSPYRRKGLLYKKHEEYFGKDDDRVLFVKGPTKLFNPTISEAFIAQKMREDPEVARAEWLGEFRTDIADLLPPEAVRDVTDQDVRERPFERRWRYVAFADPSGGSSDSMTMAIAHQEGDTSVLDVVRERKPPFNPEAVTAEFAEVARSYRCSTIRGDRYAGDWVSSAFSKAGVHYAPTEKSKSDLYRDFVPMVLSKSVALLTNERLFSQITALERSTRQGGKDLVDHPPGGHDDVANAAVGALVHAAARDRYGVGTARVPKALLGYQSAKRMLRMRA